MNNQRRDRINEICLQIETLLDLVQELQDEEQTCFDNLTEGLQASERGQSMEAAAETLSDAVDSLAEAIQSLEVAAE